MILTQIARLCQSRRLRWLFLILLSIIALIFFQHRVDKIPISSNSTSEIVTDSEIIPAFKQFTPTSLQPPAPSVVCDEGDPFAQSTRFAIEGATSAQSARTKADWDRVAQHWVQAVAWMQAVPINSPQRAFAEKKVQEYMRNLAYSQQQAANAVAWRNMGSFNSDILDEQLKLYQSYVATLGRPDVLIIGSSRALQGVDPRELIYGLSSRGYSGIKVFNFSVNGATAQVVYYILRHLLTQPQLPRMLIWADGLRAFNSGRVDRTYNLITESEGNRLLLAGVRPELSPLNPAPNPVCYQLPGTCTNNGASLRNLDLVRDYPTSSLSSLPITPVVDLSPISDPDLAYTPINSPTATITQRKLIQETATLDANGFIPISEQFDPSSYYRYRPRVPGQYDSDYANFRLTGEQETALRSIVNFAKGWQIPLIFVNLPLTQDYLDPVRQAAETQFQAWMDRQSQQQGFIFRDLSQRWLTRYDYFVDPSHLNRYGAQAVARLLASDNSLPWPTSRR